MTVGKGEGVKRGSFSRSRLVTSLGFAAQRLCVCSLPLCPGPGALSHVEIRMGLCRIGPSTPHVLLSSLTFLPFRFPHLLYTHPALREAAVSSHLLGLYFGIYSSFLDLRQGCQRNQLEAPLPPLSLCSPGNSKGPSPKAKDVLGTYVPAQPGNNSKALGGGVASIITTGKRDMMPC